MKKSLLIFGLIAVLFSLPSSARAEDEEEKKVPEIACDVNGSQKIMKAADACKAAGGTVVAALPSPDPEYEDRVNYDFDKMLKIDPAILSEEQFYACERGLFDGFQGSGGYFLGKEEISWIRKGVAALVSKGVKLPNESNSDADRGEAIAESYFNMDDYKNSTEEYRRNGDSGGAEWAEWLANNGELKSGMVKIVEYPGKIPWGPVASETARAEDKRYLFAAYFKGPVYRYDKAKDKHAVIFAPESKYDWADLLKWDGKRLMIKCRDVGVVGDSFEFDNATNNLKQVGGKQA